MTGRPTAAGTYPVTITIKNKYGQASLSNNVTIAQGATPVVDPTIVSSVLRVATVGQAYSFSLTGSGGTGPYTWSATGLPEGLSVNGENIEGTTTAAPPGTYPVIITLTDASSPAKTATKTLNLILNAATTPPPANEPLVMETASLPGATVGSSYNATLSASGGTAPYTWSATGLPAGLSVNSNKIVGTSNASPGLYSVAVKVKDASSPAKTVTKNLTINLAATSQPPATTNPAITTASLPGATVGSSYNATLSANGGTAPYGWSATGLPAGLSIAGNNIQGTPTASAGAYSVNITVTDASSPARTATKTLNLVLSAATSTQPPPSGGENPGGNGGDPGGSNGGGTGPSAPPLQEPLAPAGPPSVMPDTGADRLIRGKDRVKTSALIADEPEFNNATELVVINSASPIDGVIATPFAIAKKAPVMYGLSTDVGPDVLARINKGIKVVTLVGAARIAPETKAQLEAKGVKVNELKGRNRFDTAVLASRQIPGADKAFIADGTTLVDSMAASVAAGRMNGIVLLCNSDMPVAEVTAYLKERPLPVTTVGGPAGRAYPGTRIAGQDRYDTGNSLAKTYMLDGAPVVATSGQSQVDAVPAAVLAALQNGALTYVAPGKTTTQALADLAASTGKKAGNTIYIGR